MIHEFEILQVCPHVHAYLEATLRLAGLDKAVGGDGTLDLSGIGLVATLDPQYKNVETQRLEWLLPIVTGEDDMHTNRKTVALAGLLAVGHDGRPALDLARKAVP